MAFKVKEIEVKRGLDEAIKTLHLDVYNCEVQGQVNYLRDKMKGIDN